MGTLPPERITPTPPFQTVGLDFAGPINTSRGNPRKPTYIKSYICVFVCLSTKATRLEVCSNLSTNTFLATFRHFTARRGYPKIVMSDNGNTFVGANRHLQKLHSFLRDKSLHQTISHLASNHGIEWKFIPARTPHMGGLWEAAVRSVKIHLRKVVGDRTLSFEQLTTLTAEVEAILNSRPLVDFGLDTDSIPQALTPGHFLVGMPLMAPPIEVNQESTLQGLKRWELTKILMADFWKVWNTSYLQSLQVRLHWLRPTYNFKVVDIVLKDESLSEHHRWPLGKILATHPDRDGNVRVVDLLIKGKEYQRSTNRLILLPTQVDQAASGEDVQVQDQ